MVTIEPFISRESVRSALEGMLHHSKSEQESPLEYLTLIDEWLHKNNIPAAENRRLFAISTILSDLITQQLSFHRNNFGLPTPDIRESLAHACEAVKQDSRSKSAELIGWSILYYRYVRVDLSLSPGDYCSISFIDERSLRRHQTKAIERLRDLLTEREGAARLANKRLRLLGELPSNFSDQVIGRDKLLEKVQQLLKESPPAHLLVTGAIGIGKTAFIRALLIRQIEQDEFDDIVWVSQAESASYVVRLLKQVLIADTQVELKDYLLSRRVAVVLDDVSALSQDVPSWGQLLEFLSAATIYITNALFLPLTPEFKHITLADLNIEEVHEIAHRSRSLWTDEDDLAHYVEHLWQMVGGNPLAVKLAVNSFNNMTFHQPLETVMQFIQIAVRKLCESLEIGAQHDILILALCPPSPISVDTIKRIWSTQSIEYSHMAQLLSCGLVCRTEDNRYMLSSHARQYVHTLYAAEPEVQVKMNELLDEVDRLK